MDKVKIKILCKCELCGGDAYFSAGEGKDTKGKTYMRYSPCPNCEGSGLSEQWIDLEEFAELLEQAIYHHEHVSHISNYFLLLELGVVDNG